MENSELTLLNLETDSLVCSLAISVAVYPLAPTIYRVYAVEKKLYASLLPKSPEIMQCSSFKVDYTKFLLSLPLHRTKAHDGH